MNKRKKIWWGVVGAVCLVITGVTLGVVIGILGGEAERGLELARFSEAQQRRIKGAIDEILEFNPVPVATVAGEAYKGAAMREGSYVESVGELGGVRLDEAVFIVDLPEIEQSYRVTYYYLTEEQEDDFSYTALASCLPVEELVYGDFDCRGDRQTVFMDDWHEIAAELSVEYGIPWEAVIAQGILESAAGTSRFAVERNNFFGIGAFDANPDNAFAYDTPEEGWRGYFENIAHVSSRTYCLHGAFAGENITNPYAYLKTIKAAGYATDPNYVELTASIVDAVVARAEKKGWESSAELAAMRSEMLTNASSYACL